MRESLIYVELVLYLISEQCVIHLTLLTSHLLSCSYYLRSEMRLKDRHVREMEERFCFLVTSDQKAKQMYQHGLKVENTDQHSLGNPSYGVYLHRHADVALKNISGNTPAGKILIIFKVRW